MYSNVKISLSTLWRQAFVDSGLGWISAWCRVCTLSLAIWGIENPIAFTSRSL